MGQKEKRHPPLLRVFPLENLKIFSVPVRCMQTFLKVKQALGSFTNQKCVS